MVESSSSFFGAPFSMLFLKILSHYCPLLCSVCHACVCAVRAVCVTRGVLSKTFFLSAVLGSVRERLLRHVRHNKSYADKHDTMLDGIIKKIFKKRFSEK